jgi:ABC-type lipoprotein export system ATPase subunit
MVIKHNIAEQLLAEHNGDIAAAIADLKQAASNSPQPKTNHPYGPVVISVQGVSKTYKVSSHTVNALKGVSVDIRQGEFVALTGTSGSGKSTLLQLIGGLDRPTNGTITVDSEDISKMNDRVISRFRNKTIGFVFQFFYLQPFLSLSTNIEVPAMFARVKPNARNPRSMAMVEAVGLADRASHLPSELSGGQMQRAAIARALMNSPKILLADEPTGNLDSANAGAIFELFEKARRQFNTTIVIVTHDRALAAKADRIVSLSDGVII